MSSAANLGLPLLQAAQAQKHVTVNEALVRLDGLTELVLQSATTATPPALPVEGQCWAVPTAAVNAWSGQDGDVALYSNGGWLFVTPQRGWRAWIADSDDPAIHDGSAWVKGALALSVNSAALIVEVAEIDHAVAAGATSTITAAIPAFSVVFGITGRVLTAITGGATTWRLGVSGAENRYGSNLGVSQGSWIRGLTGSPLTYYAATDLKLSADGGVFAAGTVRVAIHYVQLTLPTP